MSTVQQLNAALARLNESAEELVAAEAVLPPTEHDLRDHFASIRQALIVLGRRIRARAAYEEHRQ